MASLTTTSAPPDNESSNALDTVPKAEAIGHIEDMEEMGEKELKKQLIMDAREATQGEMALSPWASFKLYRKAVMWSFIFSCSVLMDGFDSGLLSAFIAFPAFQQKFGKPVGNGTYQLTAAWQLGLSNGAKVGMIIGLFFAGFFTERFGCRWTMIVGHTLMICFIFIPFFAGNIQALLVGEILQGIPWGIFQTLTTQYACEVAPIELRYYLTTWTNAQWLLGDLLSAGALRGLLRVQSEWAYRGAFALQWFFPVPILACCFFAPESPWWLVRKDRADEAVKSVKRLMQTSAGDEAARKTVQMMVHTVALERKGRDGNGRFLDMFRKENLRRTEITCVTWMVQSLCGAGLLNYGVYFFEQAGLSTADSFNMQIGLDCMGLLGTLVAWFTMKWFGRRGLFVGSLWVMFLMFCAIGFTGIPPSSNKGASWAAGALLIFSKFVFDSGVGPVVYSLVAEIPSARERAFTIVFARICYNTCQIWVGELISYQLNPTEWHWREFSAFFWAGSALLCSIWVYFRVPETKSRSFAELDILFAKKIPARQFSKTEVDPFAQDVNTDGVHFIL
jgi:SP family general alpha glucoside:H+ symporter-like MFS transporter